MVEVDLRYVTENGKDKLTSLGGKDNGLAAEKKLNLSAIAKENSKIKILVPDYIQGFHSSYFAGMFSKIIYELGNNREEFENKFIFDAKDEILEQINDGIDLCFMDTSAVKIRK